MPYFRTLTEAQEYTEQLRQRGERLASRVQLTGGTTYLVPSESGQEPYAVDLARESCTCRHWLAQNERRADGSVLPLRCKHVWAALLYRRREQLDLEADEIRRETWPL